jgi:sec-independent protein translocase protein TatA
MNLGAPELMLLLLVILVLFGGAKLPKLARSVGEAQREFRNGLKVPVADDDSPRESPSDAA